MNKILHSTFLVIVTLLLLFSADGHYYCTIKSENPDTISQNQRACFPIKAMGLFCSIAALPTVTEQFKITYRVLCRFFPSSKESVSESVFYKQYTAGGLRPAFARVTTSQPILRI